MTPVAVVPVTDAMEAAARFDPEFAVLQMADGVAPAATLLSELADFAVYTPLQERRLVAAVVLSSLVGLVIDRPTMTHARPMPNPRIPGNAARVSAPGAVLLPGT